MLTSSQIIGILSKELIQRYTITDPEDNDGNVFIDDLRLFLAEVCLNYSVKPIQLKDL